LQFLIQHSIIEIAIAIIGQLLQLIENQLLILQQVEPLQMRDSAKKT
jgi:hypothetical protein